MKTKELIAEKNIRSSLKHLSYDVVDNRYVVALVDLDGYEILRGFGRTFIEAVNDLHHNLI